ncbi:MAG TPA: glycogen debranching enzyme N-terminal domain-containing protein, partial [Bryobacteraceae bacterium]|nr:glycogen debranching enzyme N-terminal domain-containing protein [Bryobacteraceae bacterium]
MRKPPIILSGPFVDLDFALKREWLETNGLGGFASSTVIGMNTRRYHGLLTAATKPPGGRVLLLSKLEETVVVGTRRYGLSVNRYPGAIHPQGYRVLAEFRLDPLPTFSWDLDGVEFRKRVFMVHGENTTVIEYEANADCTLELRPLIAFRDSHSLTRRNDALNGNFAETEDAVVVRPYAQLPALWFAHNARQIERTGDWYFNLEYEVERERGMDYQEDLWNPFVARFGVRPGHGASVIASTEPHRADSARALRTAEMRRREAVLDASPADDPLLLQLIAAADQFLVAEGSGDTVIAGYHWLSERVPDTLIALPGLALVTGRFESAKRILR